MRDHRVLPPLESEHGVFQGSRSVACNDFSRTDGALSWPQKGFEAHPGLPGRNFPFIPAPCPWRSRFVWRKRRKECRKACHLSAGAGFKWRSRPSSPPYGGIRLIYWVFLLVALVPSPVRQCPFFFQSVRPEGLDLRLAWAQLIENTVFLRLWCISCIKNSSQVHHLGPLERGSRQGRGGKICRKMLQGRIPPSISGPETFLGSRWAERPARGCTPSGKVGGYLL